MSLIETALLKLQGSQRERAAQGERAARVERSAQSSVVPVARRKKVIIEGPKHQVSQSDLIRGGLLAPLDQAVHIAEEFRKIKRPLIHNAFSAEPRIDRGNVIMITSALPDAGKTFCAVNLAVSLSLERDLNVLLVDADVAKPHITREFGLTNAPGLIDLLLDESLDIGDVLVRTDLNDVQVLPAGRSHSQATELLASHRMSRIVEELATRYADRLILLDSPPLLVTSESQAVAGQVGQITVVVEAGRTSHQELAQTLETFDPSKAVSLLLNKSRNWGWGASGDYSGEYGKYGFVNG